MEKEAMAMVRDGVVTIPEAMRITGFGRTFLYGAMASGELPYVKIGAGRRIPRRALELWLAKGLIVAGDRVVGSA